MEAIIVSLIFGAIFGVFYLYFSTRNKERLALIEKGADANIFVKKRKKSSNISRAFIISTAFLLMGIGFGVFLASLLEAYTVIESDALYPALIFFMAGLGLFIGFLQSRKWMDN